MMRTSRGVGLLSIVVLACGLSPVAASETDPASAAADTTASRYARAADQPIDQAYSNKIREFTTDPRFNTPLTDYLPASSTVPTPEKSTGHVSGAPNFLPYTADVHRYFRELAASSPRVKVFTIGKSEEGREMIAVAIADENLLADLDANKARLAQLADPRTIGLDDAKADQLVAQSVPIYYITGTIHSTETGAPTALMELAYRLAVDDAPYIKHIRSHLVTLITPVVETDGRDRMVDIYNWHLANPEKNYPPLMYWGHYVAHDNNRDAMSLTLNLTRNVLDTYVGWHAQVLHDLHESVPFLYDNTIGDGPYNAWIDPILVGEWQQIGWDNVQQLTRLGMPGVFAHGGFDTWSPGYLMFIAAMHNGISRLYETFGNGGADTVKRILDPDEYQRTWYRPNPPLPVVMWSQRNNNNYEQTGLLTALDYFASNAPQFLKNYYLKGKRSIEKPQADGPAAYVFTADEKRKGSQARLLRLMQQQHAEVSRTTAAMTLTVPKVKPLVEDKKDSSAKNSDSNKNGDNSDDKSDKPKTERRTFPAGSYVVRMDQPYSRIADTLLDRQYWAPKDPQQRPYDDTGWSMGDAFNVNVVRVSDVAVLKAPMTTLVAPVDVASGIASVDATVGKLPRIAVMHTWLSTQTEGWWRQALDNLGVKYDYISTQDVSRSANLRSKYDVILFAPVGSRSQRIIDGLPMWGNPLPWKKTALTPNIGNIDSTDDIRPGLGQSGVANLKAFVNDGGLLITAEDTAQFAIDQGMAPGVFATKRENLRVVGSILQAVVVEKNSPITAGYDERMALYSEDGQSFMVSNLITGDRRLPNKKDFERETGRGGPDDVDVPQGRAYAKPDALPEAKPWQALALNEDQARNNSFLIPEALRPTVVVRFAAAKNLLISGLLDHGDEMAERAAVVDARYGKGHVLLFAGNPIWRGGTIGSYALVLNAITNFDKL